MEYTVRNAALSLTVSTMGAEARRLTTAGGEELLWNADPAQWGRCAPMCCPYCGKVEEGWYEYAGKRRQAKAQHGFVRDLEHALTARTPESLTFRLDWPGEEDTWPWAFTVETVHTLTSDGPDTAATVTNRAKEPMPLQFGFHPAFRCPFLPGGEVTDYLVRFESGRVIDLTLDLFDNDSIRYTGVGAWARLEHRSTGKYIQLDTAGYPNVLLWSKPGIPGFVCIEPWQGYPDGEHDLFRRMGALSLAPGESRTWHQRVHLSL